MQNQSSFNSEYEAVLRFVTKHNHIPYSTLDAMTQREVNLFAIRENFDFEALEQLLDHIIKALPAMRRIFTRPIMRLKDANEILPVEAVRVVNHQSVIHASFHSELWKEVGKDGMKPQKLLTIKNEDSYTTYENVALTVAVEVISRLVHKNVRYMQEILYANRTIRFNLLERDNHLSYFLAIGKLHMGYVHDYDKYRLGAERLMDKLLFVDRMVGHYKTSALYRECVPLTKKFSLKNSMVFRKQKDYHQVYLLLRWFADNKITENDEKESPDQLDGKAYSAYCILLSLFAIGHFNFTFDENPLDFTNLSASARYCDWQLHLETLNFENSCALMLSVTKDCTYRILLLPHPDRDKMDDYKQRFAANQYLVAHPDAHTEGAVKLCLFDIESFRRIQQLLLSAMIHTDSARQICPFCGQPLFSKETAEETHSLYECPTCRMQIWHLVCAVTGKPYLATSMRDFQAASKSGLHRSRRERLSTEKYQEDLLYFRNITKIDDSGNILCPHCRQNCMNNQK